MTEAIEIKELNAGIGSEDGSCEDCPLSSGSVNGYSVLASSDELRGLLEEIFTDEFMQNNTRFENYAAFRYSSAVIINWDAETLIYAPHLLDAFVKESTCFSGFDDMVKAAADIRFA